MIQNAQEMRAFIAQELDKSPLATSVRQLQSTPKLPVYTSATKPTASAAGAGAIIFVSDGGVGAFVQVSSGSAWINVG